MKAVSYTHLDVYKRQVTDQEMLFEVLHGDSPDTCLDRLLAISKSRGAPDNVTAVLMKNA